MPSFLFFQLQLRNLMVLNRWICVWIHLLHIQCIAFLFTIRSKTSININQVSWLSHTLTPLEYAPFLCPHIPISQLAQTRSFFFLNWPAITHVVVVVSHNSVSIDLIAVEVKQPNRQIKPNEKKKNWLNRWPNPPPAMTVLRNPSDVLIK